MTMEAAPVRHRGLITGCVMLATLIQVLDITIANVALPHMQGNLSTTQDQISWVLTSYIVAVAIMTPPTGFLAAKFGRKRLFVWSVAGFIVTSVLCGMAATLSQIVVFRFLQGMCGAALVPLTQALLLDIYPRERHGYALALWGLGTMVGPILGPTVGGYLTEFYSWRYVFFINLPLGVMALLGILAFVPETPVDRDRPFDVVGFSLLSLAIASLQLMLDRGELKGWFSSTEIVVEATLAGLGLYLFVVHMLTADRPFLDPRMFQDLNFVTGIGLIFVMGLILLATTALMPPFLQDLLGYPVLTAGFVLGPRGIGTTFAMLAVGRLAGRMDNRLLILFGLGMTAFSLWQMTEFTVDVSMATIVWIGVIQGFGMGFLWIPLSMIAFATLPPQRRTEAAGMFNLMRNIGSSVGIATMVALLSQNKQINHAALAEHVTPFNPALREAAAPPAWSLDSVGTLMALNEAIVREATSIAYLNDFRLLLYITLAAMPLLLLVRHPGR